MEVKTIEQFMSKRTLDRLYLLDVWDKFSFEQKMKLAIAYIEMDNLQEEYKKADYKLARDREAFKKLEHKLDLLIDNFNKLKKDLINETK